jgi:adenosylhomocysteine nucleosidase
MTFAVLSALAEEQQGITQQIENLQVREIAGRNFRVGQLAGVPVVMVVGRIGKVAAATTATILCEHFGARHLVFSGVSCGIGKGLQIGDVVVGTSFVQHDMNASPIFPRWEVPLYGRSDFAADPALVHLATQAVDAAVAEVNAQQALLPTGRKYKVHTGQVITGDTFVSGATARARLAEQHPRALVGDMESAAVAQVCIDYGVPFTAVRQVSDLAGETAAEDFSQFIQNQAAPFARNYLPRLARLLATV